MLLVNTDTLSKKVSKLDRNSYPLIGDCASITLIENSNDGNKIHYCVYMDGTRRDALKIPAGGSRLACSPETGLMNNDGSGNIRSLDNFFMNGNEVFQFIMSDIPPLIENTLNYANLSHNCIDWYLFHQPNKFILQKLSQKLEINNEKLFMNIVEKYGNTSGSSIPLTITDNLNNLLIDNTYKCCICAFGGGLSYGAMIMDLGNLEFCETHISTY